MIIETSRDILNLSIAGSIALVALFICWMMYYMIATIRNVHKMTLSIREKVELADSILRLLKKKLEQGSNHAAIVADSLIKIAGFVINKYGTANSAGKKSNRKK